MSVCTEKLQDMSREALLARQLELQKAYEDYRARGLQLDMSRGKPSKEQLDLTLDMLECVNARDGYTAENGLDVRNYGLLDGLPEAKRLFGGMLHMPPEAVIVGGNSSLNMMFDYIATAYSHGVCGHEAWCRQGKVKFLCPAPGYDRHFGVTEYFGIEMLTVDMTPDGPDMEQVETLIRDPLVKGMWCVPMYSNPDGITYSDETVRRLAAMQPAAPDFRIMWDNAYCVHHLYDEGDTLLDIYPELQKHGREDMVIMFASTSKISFPGSGIAAIGASDANLAEIRKQMKIQTIGHDKLNQLRHARFFKDIHGMVQHMKKHADIMRPKFDIVLETLENEIGGLGIGSWIAPRGGYFISFDSMDGCAKKIVAKAKEAGLVMTPAGATFPYGKDPHDSNIRIAPSYPTVEELKLATEIFILSIKLVSIDKLLESK